MYRASSSGGESLSAAQRGRGWGPLRSNGRVRWCPEQPRYSLVNFAEREWRALLIQDRSMAELTGYEGLNMHAKAVVEGIALSPRPIQRNDRLSFESRSPVLWRSIGLKRLRDASSGIPGLLPSLPTARLEPPPELRRDSPSIARNAQTLGAQPSTGAQAQGLGRPYRSINETKRPVGCCPIPDRTPSMRALHP
jgi:hypothetical protein